MMRYITTLCCLLMHCSLFIATDYTDREAEYNSEFTEAIEIAYGDGYLSSGGEQTVERLTHDLALDGATFLDFGCGVGGPALYLAQKHSVDITAVDVEPYVISVAQKNKEQAGDLKGNVTFQVIPGEQQLPFDDDQFDVIYANECILHVHNKKLLFSEFHRVLKPGGTLLIHDWLHASSDHSQEMETFLHADGLTFHLITPAEYADLLIQTGFHDVAMDNSSQITLDETEFVLTQLDGPLSTQVCQKYGAGYLKEYKDSFKLQALVFERKEMLTYVITATKRSV